MTNSYFKEKRFNEQAGEYDYFFPMEISDQSGREFARANNLKIVRARLGCRAINAVEIPCVRQEDLDRGIRTPEEIQQRIYHELCRDELNAQEERKRDGRCVIPDAYGKVKRCPCWKPNPDYVPGGNQPKMLPVSCAGCRYEEYRNTHSVVNFSVPDKNDDNGGMTVYEPASQSACSQGDTVEKSLKELIYEISENYPKLKETATLYLTGYSLTEISEKLGLPTSTVYNRISKIKKLAEELLDNMIIF